MTQHILFDIVPVVVSVTVGGVALLRFVNSRIDRRFEFIKQVLDRKDEQLREEVNARHAMDVRLHAIETKVDGLPTNDRIDRLFDALTKMNARVAVVEERSNAVVDGVRRIEDYLIGQKGNP